MTESNLLVISNNFPNQDDSFVGGIFVKEQIEYIKNYFDIVYVISPVAYGMERLRNTTHKNYQYDNVKVYFPKYINNPIFWYYCKPMWVNLETKAINSLIEKEHLHFDLIHAHFTWPSGAVGVELKYKYSVPIVITEHASSTFIKAIENYDKIFINTWTNASKIILVRNRDVSAFNRVRIPMQNVTSVPNGYDSNKFRPINTQKCRDALNLPHNKHIILNVGNFYSEVKGHRYLIEAIYQILAKRTDIICVIIGGGRLRNVIEAQIQSLGLEDFIILAGIRPHHEIPLWINACDIFVLPSIRESFGIVQIEAMACGKPVVATRNGGSEEIITSEDCGFLVDPANSKDLAEKILEALDLRWDLEKIVAHADRYTLKSIAKELVSIYSKELTIK